MNVYRRTRVTHVRYMHLIAYMHMQIFLMFWIIRGLLTSLIFICVGVCIPNIGMGSSEVNEFSSTPWKINMEHTNHPERKESDLPNLYDYVPC